MTHVRAELQRMVPKRVRYISNPLELVFLLVERAIALINLQRIPELKRGASQLIDGDSRHPRGIGVIEVQSRYSSIFGGRGSQPVGIHEYSVAEESETEISYPVVVDQVRCSVGQALISQRRGACEVRIRELISSSEGSIGSRRA